ncbi:MAG: type II toxin-antitoxin system CcdA family antitoxin [Proteobacteria bacterium]|nr:type II toxin-antitoxin system CcdA family antitoxin [Pseudomonadota bacterium]
MLESISERRARSSSQSPRRATNLSLSADVLEAAKALNINISQTCDAHLRKAVNKELARRWREEYADFVAAYNEVLVAEGLLLDEWKTF